MARDDDNDKDTSDKRRAAEGKPSKAKENGDGKKADVKADAKKADAKKAEPAADKPRDKAKDKAVEKADKPVAKKVKEGKVREEDVPAKAARPPVAGHAHAAHTHGHHAPNRKEYWKIFGVLFALTVLEVAVAQIPGIGKTLLVIALVGLALAKAACVALFYMHLKHETRVLRAWVALPFAAPAVYALVLIAEAAWRLTR